MSWRTRFFSAFLVMTTVNAIGLFILPKTAKTETLPTRTEFGTYVAALPIEPKQVQPSAIEQRWHDYIAALLAPPEPSVPAENMQEFGTYVAALPIETVATPASETDQQLQQLLVAFLLPQTATVSTPDFGNDVVALPIALDREQTVTDFPDSEVALLSLPEAPPDAIENTIENTNAPSQNLPQSEAEQKYANYLVALREQGQPPNAENTDLQITSTPTSSDLKFFSPRANEVLDVPATTVTVQYPLNIAVELSVNGELVDSSLIGGTETNNTTNSVTQTWYGVPLHQGENNLTVKIKTGDRAGESTAIKVYVRGNTKQITVQTQESRIPADGRSTATIQGQLLDDKGNRANEDAIVTLAASAGEFVGTDAKPDREGFQVLARKGEFTAQLRSGLQAQTVRIRAEAFELEAFTQFQFETNLRSSLVTGVIDLRLGARGTDFYKSFRDFLPPDEDNRTELSFHTAVFATGKIGEWLFTGAYNSDRTLNQKCDGTSGLFRDYQVCDRNYPVYGDSSKVEAVTPSQDSLYLRFERSTSIPGAEPDYVMWGDYDTKEFARSSQEYTATSRNLHGFKANYNLGDFQLSLFYGDNVEGFQRDTIPPDGTSGFYFLSRRLLVPGSENISIEVEELNRPGTVLARQQLVRGTDYDIDYDRGTLLFREPIFRTGVDDNGQVLVQRVIATYQYESQEKDNRIYGGRVQYNISRQLNYESWIGATYLKEDHGIREFELYGADAQIAISDKIHLIAEYAHSQNDSEMMGEVSGSAYRLEAEGEITKGIQGRAYFRSTDTGFSNNATTSFVPGQTRYGAQVTGQVAAKTNVRLQYDHEDNRGVAPQPLDNFTDLFSPRTEAVPGSNVDNSLTTITAGVQQQIGEANVTVDWVHRHREDRIEPNALNSTSDQLRSRLQLPLTDTLTFLAQNELTLSNEEDAVYPDRTILGLDWKVAPDLSIRLAQQFYTGGQNDGNSITSLDFIGERKFGSDTVLNGRYSILNGGDGMTTQGAIGIKQGLTIAPGLKLDLGYEHVFGSFFNRTGAGKQFAQPFTAGQSASSIGVDSGDNYHIGLAYTPSSDFKASTRYEHRNSSGGSNTVISADVTGKISPALTGLVRYQQANASNQRLSGLGDTANLKVGLAYRDPKNDKFNALLRYEYRKNPSTIPDTILLGSGTGSKDHTFALETIYAPDWRWELYGKYAIRHSTSYLAEDLVNSSTVNLAQLRATYRLNDRIDLVGEARWINQPSENRSETGFVAEAGYYLTPNLRLSAGYAFGHVNDDDFSGSRSAGGAYFGLTVKLNELFDGFGLQKPLPALPKSKVQPVAKRSSEPSRKIPPTPLKKGGESSLTPPQANSEAISPTPVLEDEEKSTQIQSQLDRMSSIPVRLRGE